MTDIPPPSPDKPLRLVVPRAWHDVVAEHQRLLGRPRRDHLPELLQTLAARAARGDLGWARHDLVRCAALLLWAIEQLDDEPEADNGQPPAG